MGRHGSVGRSGRMRRGMLGLLCAFASAVAGTSTSSSVQARAGAQRYIGESFDMRLLYSPGAKMCIGQQSQLTLLISQDGLYEDANGQPYTIQRHNGRLGSGTVSTNVSNSNVADLRLLSSQLNGVRTVTFQVTANQVGRARMTFTYENVAINGPVPVVTANVEVTECDYKLDTASMWIIHPNRVVVTGTFVHTMLIADPTSTGANLAPQNGAEAENIVGNYTPPCVGFFEVPNTRVIVDGEVDLTAHKVKIDITWFAIPVGTVVDCGGPAHGSRLDDAEPQPVHIELPVSGGHSSKPQVLHAPGVGDYTDSIVFTVTPVHR